jgi:hypothetical protein
LKAKRLTWAELVKADSACQTLLVLRNRNVVAVLQNRCEQQGHIVVSDPLYRNGDAFFLPSIALERVWDGRALIVKPRSPVNRKANWALLALAGGLLITEMSVQTYVHRGNGSVPTPAALGTNQISSAETKARSLEGAPMMETSLELSTSDRIGELTEITTVSFAAVAAEDLVMAWSASDTVGPLPAQELASSLSEFPTPLQPDPGYRPQPSPITPGETAVLRPRKSSPLEGNPPIPARQLIRAVAIFPSVPTAVRIAPGPSGLPDLPGAKTPDRVDGPGTGPIRRPPTTAYARNAPPASALVARNLDAPSEDAAGYRFSAPTGPCVRPTLSAPDAAGAPVRICD